MSNRYFITYSEHYLPRPHTDPILATAGFHEAPPGEACLLCGALSHKSGRCPNALCFRCHEPGHKSNDCPQKNVLRRGTFCKKCGRSGHFAAKCPERLLEFSKETAARGELSAICFVCGKRGHYSCKPSAAQQPRSRLYCYRCGRIGHAGHDCRIRPLLSHAHTHSAMDDPRPPPQNNHSSHSSTSGNHRGGYGSSRSDREQRNRSYGGFSNEPPSYYDRPSKRRRMT